MATWLHNTHTHTHSTCFSITQDYRQLSNNTTDTVTATSYHTLWQLLMPPPLTGIHGRLERILSSSMCSKTDTTHSQVKLFSRTQVWHARILLLKFLRQKLVDAQYQCKNSSVFHCGLFVHIYQLHPTQGSCRIFASKFPNFQRPLSHTKIPLLWSCMHNLTTLKVLWHTNLIQVWEWF